MTNDQGQMTDEAVAGAQEARVDGLGREKENEEEDRERVGAARVEWGARVEAGARRLGREQEKDEEERERVGGRRSEFGDGRSGSESGWIRLGRLRCDG